MKKLTFISAMCLFASSVCASDLVDIKISDLKISKIEIPTPVQAVTEPVKCNHVSGEITRLNLLAQTAKSLLFTYADTEALFTEFTVMWKPILEKFGLKPTTTEYKNSFGTLNYESADGLVVRDFMAEKLNYDALDPAAIKKLQHELLEPLEQAGMTPLASFTIKNEIFRPTFNIYYLTKPDENQDHEVQLRHLMNGDDIDYDLLQNAGVKIIRKDASFSMVYIGKLLGFKSKLAADEAAANAKLADYKKFLTEQKKEFIGARVAKLTEPFTAGDNTYNYYLNVYFYQ